GWLERIGLDTPEILARSHALQDRFVAGLAALGLPDLDPGRLLVPLDEPRRGRFLTYETARAGAIHERLMAADIVTDYRADRLRFGFGLYHDPDDVPAMVDRIAADLAG